LTFFKILLYYGKKRKPLKEETMVKRIAFLSLILIASLLAIGNMVNNVALLGEDAIPQKINYQGYLTDSAGNPINGSLSMTFKIYDAASGGNELWSETRAVSVENGLFNVILGEVNSISPGIFTPGARRWLELVIAGNPLSPRTEITAVGFSYKAVDADKLEGNSLSDLDNRYVNENQENAINSQMIVDRTILGQDLNQMGANINQVLKWNGTTWQPANDEVDGDNAWVRGTPDSVLYTIRQLGIARGGADNMLYGSNRFTHVNLGVACTTGTSGQNYLYPTVGGGYHNRATNGAATVSGGANNLAGATAATVGGGANNIASGDHATVGGGYHNIASGLEAMVGGGNSNTASGTDATVAGGASNTASGAGAMVGGGAVNTASGYCATVAGGCIDTASGNYATVSGGEQNTASGNYATIAGGRYNTASGYYATVGGGSDNTASGYRATVGGGWSNYVSDTAATVAGGRADTASGRLATVGGGYRNKALGLAATIGGGADNTASGECATVGGGNSNTASDYYATVGGGVYNTASGNCATVNGGYADTAAGYYSFAVGCRSIVPAGYTNSAAFNGQTATASNQLRCGTLSKAGGTFTIDHPLDPYNKILNHYFIEGPEMRNLYDGEVILDASGRATVHLPDYFSILNRKPRIQLTGVGTSDVYVLEDIKGNTFVIGGKPGTKVYWQVTGERADVSAEAIRRLMPVEQLKTGALSGRMLDDEFLSGCMEQLEREGKAQGINFRTNEGRKRYEEMKKLPKIKEK
jgi:hypothetical protein